MTPSEKAALVEEFAKMLDGSIRKIIHEEMSKRQPVVNVHPAITVKAPEVTFSPVVNPTPITVNVPEGPPPMVRIDAPEAPVEKRDGKKYRILRDDQGRIAGIEVTF